MPSLSRLPVFVAGALAGFAAVAILSPDGALGADPELVNVLRAMGLIKGAILVAALAALLWRFRTPLPLRAAGMYFLGAALAAGACTAISRLAFIGVSSVVFYAGLALLVAGALSDYRRSLSRKDTDVPLIR